MGISPVNFSFTTYVLPTVDTNVTSPEEYLWISLMGTDTVTSSPTQSSIDFADGNVAELQNLTLWFYQPNQAEGNYRIDNAIVDSATIQFDINGIAEISWSGRGLTLVEDNTVPTPTDRTGLTNYIKNRLSTISLTMNSVPYTLALTGGSININNNVQFYGRTELGKTTTYDGHYTGNRKVSGGLNFYMRSGTNESVDLFNEILSNASTDTYESTYLANIAINLGGASNTPRLTITIPQALLNIPRKDFREVIALTIPFVAQEEASNYLSVTYIN